MNFTLINSHNQISAGVEWQLNYESKRGTEKKSGRWIEYSTTEWNRNKYTILSPIMMCAVQ